MIRIRSNKSTKTKDSLLKIKNQAHFDALDTFAQRGVEALASATRIDTGRTANSWTYSIERGRKKTAIHWSNTNVINGNNVAILLQYGHGTGTGGYVEGYDYINPAIRPIFDEIANDVWKQISVL